MQKREIANINNLNIVRVAMEKLINRHGSMPALGVYYGYSGYGKSATVTAVAMEVNAYYVEMKSVWSKKVFAEILCFELGLGAGRTVSACLDLITEQLAASQRPLIIDEADYAASKPGFIEFIRDIHDSSQSPIILVGEEQLPNKLKKYERFHSRVLAWQPAHPVSYEDTLLLASIYASGINIAEDLLRKITDLAHGSVRRVMINLVNIANFSDENNLPCVSLENLNEIQIYTGEAPKRKG